MAARKKAEATISVALRLSVARDLVTVLRKFSELQMERMQVGDLVRADRLLALNLYRRDLENALEGKDGRDS